MSVLIYQSIPKAPPPPPAILLFWKILIKLLCQLITWSNALPARASKRVKFHILSVSCHSVWLEIALSSSAYRLSAKGFWYYLIENPLKPSFDIHLHNRFPKKRQEDTITQTEKLGPSIVNNHSGRRLRNSSRER